MSGFLSKWANFVNDRLKTKIILNFTLVTIIVGAFIFFCNLPARSMSLDSTNTEKLILLTNQERLKHNLPPLFPNETLTLAAGNKARDLLKEQYFSHNSPTGKKFSTWVKDVKYEYEIIGENLALGFGSEEVIITAWMESIKHRENILHTKFREIGIAVIRGEYQGQQTKMVVQIFGSTNGLKLSEIFLPYQESAHKYFKNKLNSYI